ncbi:MAG: polynucleotide kinase-phosphatase [Deltaproteobacteria bacterium]|jgi:protein phosphatase|nr:polynucleotide kinase-phosphatase [Deltaproteobacteria bacterium]
MLIEIPNKCLVCLVGSTGSGKSRFGRTYFKPTEVLSSDFFRGLVSDDENDQSATEDAFACLKQVAAARLKAGKLTVIDATNLKQEDRAVYINLAKNYDLFAVAIVLDPGLAVCRERNQGRPERASMPDRVIVRHHQQLNRSIRHLTNEGFRRVHVVKSQAEADSVQVVRIPLWTDRSLESGPFDVIGDVHGCWAELTKLLSKLGYRVDAENFTAEPPLGRKIVFLGDLVDRGPEVVKVLKLVMNMAAAEKALCVPGNHEVKLHRFLSGADVKPTHGLDQTIKELQDQGPEFTAKVKDFIGQMVSHFVLDGGRLVVAHAGLPERYHGRSSNRVRQFCLYGETTGELDGFGLPVRLDWTEDYRGRALVLYGHIPASTVRCSNNTICLDSGCVFGGSLSAYRYPEKEIISIEAEKIYYKPIKPLEEQAAETDGLINLGMVSGPKIINTALEGPIKISAEHLAPALEIMARFTINPLWLIYLPPTMSPCEASDMPDYLEYPTEAFNYFSKRGVEKVICQTKHMGSRAVVVLSRSSQTAAARFGETDGTRGVIYTRTGRPFFSEASLARTIIDRLAETLEATGFFDRFKTDWAALDCELLPWSAKAQSLITEHYAPIGAAASGGLAASLGSLIQALARKDLSQEAQKTLQRYQERFAERFDSVQKYVQAWRRYSWEVDGLEGLRLAPFQILAVEGQVLSSLDHGEHLKILREHLAANPLFQATESLVVDTSDPLSLTCGEQFWLEMTEAGGEGMVLKPLAGLGENSRSKKIPQPALKCRGREYLRIIYGPEYSAPANMVRLKHRYLGRKRALAINEYALGLEALERFVGRASVERVHECVFGVLALETEPVDPRL